MVFVDELGTDWAAPDASLKANDREIVSPRRVTSGQVTRPVVLEKVQFVSKTPRPNGPWSQPRPKPTPPKNSAPNPPPIMWASSSCPLRSGLHACPTSALGPKVLSVELKPAGVERNAAESSCDARDGEVDDVESVHAATMRSAAAAATIRGVKPFMGSSFFVF